MKNSPLERKIFSVLLSLPRCRPLSWRKIEYIQVQQASIMQTIAYFRKIEENDPATVIIDLLERMRAKNFSQRQRKFLLQQGAELQKVRNQTYLYGVGDNKSFPLVGEEKSSSWSPEGAFFVTLSKEIATPVSMILNEMTWEQVRELVVGLNWNANMLTEEGKMRNQNYQYQEKFEKENDMDALREALKD